MQLHVHISAGDAIRQNIEPGYHAISVDTHEDLTSGEREFLASRVREKDARAIYRPDRAKVLTPTLDGLLDALRKDLADAEKEAAKQRQQADREAACREFSRGELSAAILSRSVGALVDEYTDDYAIPSTKDRFDGRAFVKGSGLDCPHGFQFSKSDLSREAREHINLVNARWKERQEERSARVEAKRAAEAERKEAEVSDWIKAHGSEHLRALLEEGIEFQAIYRDERLQKERPGWAWFHSFQDDYTTDEPRNPPLEAVQLLRRCREDVPDVELAFLQACYSGGPSGYSLQADFLDRTIIWIGENDSPVAIAK